jgi:beta-glucosidase
MKLLTYALLLLIGAYSLSCSQKTIVPASSTQSIDPFIEDLISKMTIDEKLGQMTLYTTDWESTGPTIRAGYQDDIRSGRCGALFNSHTVDFTTSLQKIAVEESRLKIPLLFGYDVIHGYKTIFPIPLAEACSWDMDAIEKSASVMSQEAAAAGLHWTFAPMVDITRDPRWGRVMEGSGEDPYLGSRIAEARVKGIQGPGLGNTDRLVACVKHFAAYGAPLGGRDYNSVEISERVFRETYLPPYEAAIKAGAKTIMTSFNDYNGVPATANKYLFTDILRNEWGFNGFVVTDYTSINELVEHRVAKDETEAGILALNAGIDMDMQSAAFQEKIKAGLNDGRITLAQIDNSVRRILTIKKQLGLFDNPYKFSNKSRESTEIMSQGNLEASRDVARKSVVLLKNDGVLPLKGKNLKVLVAGPLATDKENLTGAWSASGEGRHCVSLLDGLVSHPNAKGISFDYTKGCEILGSDKSNFEETVKKARSADVIILAIGENKDLSGEAASRAIIRIPGVQEELLLALKGTGKPIITVVMNGRPLVLNDVHENSNAILEAWWLGTQAGNALADVILGAYNPSGKLTISFPRHEGQIPVFYAAKSTGRPPVEGIKWNSKYLDIPNSPLYPFGFGLSYTKFEYSAVSSDKTSFGPEESLQVSVTVKNTGNYDGEEVVQLYIRDLVATVTRPERELKAFKKVGIKKGETIKVSFTLTKKDFSFYNQQMKFTVEPGDFEIFVGGSSETANKTKVTIK